MKITFQPTDRFAEEAREPSHFPNSRPRDAATLILIDRAGAVPKVLLGRRHHGHKFMPGKFVFPGGRVEPSDRLMPAGTPLAPAVEAKLMQETPRASAIKARTFALAAIRETFEETGLMLGAKRAEAPAVPEGPWTAFAQARVHPDLAAIHFIARAVTPPRRARRFDTRFFAADANLIAHRIDGVVGPNAELVELVWLPITKAKRLELASITKVILEDLEAQISEGFSQHLPIPFYRMHRNKRVCSML
jgi:8-oxo-dGTP pyrophosphatase MutT (NUDIX family)